jgi:RHS repeat-associated protein
MKKTINRLIAAACLLPALGMAGIVTVNPVADAHAHSYYSWVNYGQADNVLAYRALWDGTLVVTEGYLRFDTSAVPQVVSAKLRLNVTGTPAMPTDVYAVANTSWIETTLTWWNRPAFGSTLGRITPTSTSTSSWTEVDVTPYVQSEKNAGRNILTLGLRNNYIWGGNLISRSRETATPPQLVLVTNDAPTVSLTAPTTGSTFTGPASLTLTATAADADGSIASVEFYNGATLIGAGTLNGGSYALDWTNVGAGSYSITAKATDNQGAATVSAPVSISVSAPNVAPSISLTSPTEGSSYTAPASITLTADASDSDGSIASVEFYDGATLIASVTAPPYSHTWNDVPGGSHSITAKATDNQGASSTSAPVSVIVNAVLASNVYYIHADHLNTPRVITDSSNKVVWRWDADPFGASTANEDPDGDGAKFTYNLRFPGQYYDKETNLHYNYFRDYDPTTGRYVQSDPIGLEGGGNTYAYVEGNPLSSIDPMGLATCMFITGEGRLICFPDNPSNGFVDIPVASGNNGGGTQCKNNSSCTGMPNRGPIPEGWWQWTNGSTSKPNGRVLEPISGVTDPLNRDLFRSHSCLNPFGPSMGPKFCSEGCVTGTAKDIKKLNKLLDAEPGSMLYVAP